MIQVGSRQQKYLLAGSSKHTPDGLADADEILEVRRPERDRHESKPRL
jgi:hypothetical protein